MEKVILVDMDDVTIKSSPLIQKYVQSKTIYKKEVLDVLEYRLALAKYNHDIVKKIISDAYAKKEKPKLPVRIKAGSNDVIRRNDANINESMQTVFKRWYFEPLELAIKEEKEASLLREMFLEKRDNFLECDNFDNSASVVDYNSIYTLENADINVTNVVRDLTYNDEFSRVYELSHYNGNRELKAKKSFNDKLFGNTVPFLGLRFHLDKYVEGKRRKRSSKAEFVMKLFNITDLSNYYLIDDSVENVIDWRNHGGKAIMFKPFTNEEIENNICDIDIDGVYRLLNFTEEDILEAVYELDNSKQLIKK